MRSSSGQPGNASIWRVNDDFGYMPLQAHRINWPALAPEPLRADESIGPHLGEDLWDLDMFVGLAGYCQACVVRQAAREWQQAFQ